VKCAQHLSDFDRVIKSEKRQIPESEKGITAEAVRFDEEEARSTKEPGKMAVSFTGGMSRLLSSAP
jgi:hypothetical protein